MPADAAGDKVQAGSKHIARAKRPSSAPAEQNKLSSETRTGRDLAGLLTVTPTITLEDELTQFEGMLALRPPSRELVQTQTMNSTCGNIVAATNLNDRVSSITTTSTHSITSPTVQSLVSRMTRPRPRSAYLYTPVVHSNACKTCHLTGESHVDNAAYLVSERHAPTPTPTMNVVKSQASKFLTTRKDILLRSHTSNFKHALSCDYHPFSEKPSTWSAATGLRQSAQDALHQQQQREQRAKERLHQRRKMLQRKRDDAITERPRSAVALPYREIVDTEKLRLRLENPNPRMRRKQVRCKKDRYKQSVRPKVFGAFGERH